ncbi:MAG: glycosyltransferase [Proteobacteria bacterium]|nr:glycosyltransferase [Pseudomonadota bacterium]
MPTSSPSSTSAYTPPIRIAYLLADAGVPYLDSQKGASIHARSLVRAFEQEGCEVDVYAFRKGRKRVEGFNCRQISKSRLTQWYLGKVLDRGIFVNPFASKAKRKRARENWTAPNWMVAIGVILWQRDFYKFTLKECRKRKTDFLYARNAWLGGACARLKRALNIPLALEVNAVVTIEKATRKEIAFASLTKKTECDAIATAGLVLPVTRELKQQIIELSGAAPEKVTVTPNAVDLDIFSPAPAPADGANASDRDFIIGCVHSFKAYHGMEVLLEAAVRLRESIPRLKVRLVGGGGDLERVRQEASDMGLDGCVEFTGTVAHHEVPHHLRDCAVCVAPYVGEENLYGCPMKLYEYMALKVPIVAAAWGDIPNILTHEQTAYLHTIGDAESLADYITRIHADPDHAARMAEAAYKLVESHTWRSIARKILDWHARSGASGGTIGGGGANKPRGEINSAAEEKPSASQPRSGSAGKTIALRQKALT